MKSRSLFAIFIALMMLLTVGSAAAEPLYAPAGTAFTYQGRLTDGGHPANANYDLEFSLWDAVDLAAVQVGSTLHLANVAVTDGLFTVQLDFGNVFDGTALWLQIGVAAGGSGGPYTTLDPRQPLTATPYALFAMNAAGAPWDGLTGVPAGFADNVDNGSSYQNVVVVAKSGGDFTTITAALNSISASDSNRYLIYVAPGVYSERVTMEPFVDIQGSGELTTKITFTGSNLSDTGTLLGANNAELRFLTVENTGGDLRAVAIYNGSASPRLTHVNAAAMGGTTFNYGVYNDQSSLTMTDVTVTATGGGASYGVSNNTSSPTMTDVTASASGGSSQNYGVYNYASHASMTNVTANASGGDFAFGVYNYNYSSPTMTNVTASASGGTSSAGVYNYISSSPTMTNVTASASGGTNSYGVYNFESSPMMTNVTASALGVTGDNYGIWNTADTGSYTVLVNNSELRGSTTTIANDPHFTTRVFASLLDGGAVAGNGGTVTCAGVSDESYGFYAITCP